MKTLIQLGTNDGADLYQKVLMGNYDFVLLVDANPNCIELIKNRYREIKNTYFQVAAISGINKNATFYIPHYEVHKTSAHSSLSKQHVLKHGHVEKDIVELKVVCKTINDLMDEYKLTHLSELYIDCEGEDVDIIKSINFKKYIIDFIKYEHGHSTKEQQDILISLLKNEGYLIYSDGSDTTAFYE
jgi:FkbM family methyltransferase